MIPLETGPLTVEEEKEEKRQPVARAVPAVLVPKPRQRPTGNREIVEVVTGMIQVMGEDATPRSAREMEIYKNLAGHWLDLKEKIAEERIDATLLPDFYNELIEANIPREQITREKWRNRASSGSGAIVGALWGLLLGAIQATADAFAAGLDHAPFVLGPAAATFLVALVVQVHDASKAGAALTGQLLGRILGWSCLWAAVATVAALLAVGAYRAIERHNRRQEKKKNERLLGVAEDVV